MLSHATLEPLQIVNLTKIHVVSCSAGKRRTASPQSCTPARGRQQYVSCSTSEVRRWNARSHVYAKGAHGSCAQFDAVRRLCLQDTRRRSLRTGLARALGTPIIQLYAQIYACTRAHTRTHEHQATKQRHVPHVAPKKCSILVEAKRCYSTSG
jgi:hypothetical protein